MKWKILSKVLVCIMMFFASSQLSVASTSVELNSLSGTIECTSEAITDDGCRASANVGGKIYSYSGWCCCANRLAKLIRKDQQ